MLIGGLLTSTLLTLVFVPAMYTIFDDIQNLFVRLVRRDTAARPKFTGLPAPFGIPAGRPAVLAGQDREGAD